MSTIQVVVEVECGLAQEESEGFLADIIQSGLLNLIRTKQDKTFYEQKYPGLKAGLVRVLFKEGLKNEEDHHDADEN